MSDFSNLRSDRGALAPPISATIYEGRVARAHAPGDALMYTTGPEHRDVDEVNNIVNQLPGIKVFLGHPSVFPASTSGEKVVGYVESGRLDEESAVARIIVTDSEALDAIKSGVYELSLGYQCNLDEKRYQRNVKLDHLAIVERARCGPVCAMRTDMLSPIQVELDAMSASAKGKCACGALESCSCNKADEVSPPCACNSHATTYNTGEPMSDIKTDLAAEMEALKSKLEEAHKALTALEVEATNARKDAEKAKSDLEAAQAEIAAAKSDAETAIAKAKSDAAEALQNEINVRVEKRVALVTEAAQFELKDTEGNALKLDTLSDRDIKVAVIKHVDGDDVPAEKSMDYVDGVYAGALKRGRRADESRTQARVAINQMRKDGAVAVLTAGERERVAREQMLRESAEAWTKNARE